MTNSYLAHRGLLARLRLRVVLPLLQYAASSSAYFGRDLWNEQEDEYLDEHRTCESEGSRVYKAERKADRTQNDDRPFQPAIGFPILTGRGPHATLGCLYIFVDDSQPFVPKVTAALPGMAPCPAGTDDLQSGSSHLSGI